MKKTLLEQVDDGLAATVELGMHPATALLIGGLATAVLRGRFAAICSR